jgi:hypothetical protein
MVPSEDVVTDKANRLLLDVCNTPVKGFIHTGNTQKVSQSDLLKRINYEAKQNNSASRGDRLHLIVAPRHSHSNLAAYLSIAWLHLKAPL